MLGFRVSDWVEDFFSFLRCGPDHHTVNFLTGKKTQMHHIAFEVKDFAQIQNACELFGQKSIPIIWGPLRHGPGHNVSTYHHNPDNHVVEFYTELDQMKDEELGYFEPRPWHHDTPQRPKVWRGKNVPQRVGTAAHRGLREKLPPAIGLSTLACVGHSSRPRTGMPAVQAPQIVRR